MILKEDVCFFWQIFLKTVEMFQPVIVRDGFKYRHQPGSAGLMMSTHQQQVRQIAAQLEGSGQSQITIVPLESQEDSVETDADFL